MMRWLVLLILAGCSDPSVVDRESVDPVSPLAGSVVGTTSGGWQIVLPGPACGSFCEPVVAVGDRVYVKGNTFARSTHSGFEPFDPPPAPTGFYTDRHIQIAPDGALWFHSLVATYQGAFLLLGVQVARSTDGGDSWTSSYLPLDDFPTQSLGADRQWMAFDGDTAYVTFQQNSIINAFTPSGAVGQPNTANIWAARSEDQGRTWAPFRPVDGIDPTSDQASGQPIVADGRLVVPFHRYSSDVVLPSGFALAIAGDDAVQHQISSEGTMFPVIVELADGTFVVAHNTGRGFAWGMSKDLAGPWEMTDIGADPLSSPWLGVRPDGWDLVWMEGDGQGTFRLLHAADGADPKVIASDLEGGPGIRANTDFVHAGYLDGRLLVVTSDEGASAMLLLGPST